MVTMALSPEEHSSSWMKHLERAHHLAHLAARIIEEESEPSFYLEPAVRHLERGIAAMYDAFDGRADRSTALNAAHGRLWEGAIFVARSGLARAVDALREACEALISAEESFPRVPLRAMPGADLRAGADVPAFHGIKRPSLQPSFRAPPVPACDDEPEVPTLPEPRTFEELAAVAEMARRGAQKRLQMKAVAEVKPVVEAAPVMEAEIPAGFVEQPPAAISEDEFVRRWAAQCFSEIGMLGMQRVPLPGDAWRVSADLERRLIHAIDAVAALGPVAVESLETLALGAPVANPMSMFAIAMLGGCLEGRDSLAAAERVLHRYGPNNRAIADAFASAMKLAPNPFVVSAMRSLKVCPELGCRALAIEVLAYRGALGEDELAEFADEDDPDVLALALPALAKARHRNLEAALEHALGKKAALGLQAAALDAMALAAHSRAALAARAASEEELGDAALVRLAIVGGEEDARWLLARTQTMKTPKAVEALGWAGHLSAVPILLGVLETEDEEAAFAAGAALERLLGANLIESVEVLPEAIEEMDEDVREPEASSPRPSLNTLVSHPRDLAPSGSTETIEVPTKDPAKWRAYWAEHGRRFDSKLRYRRGKPYSPSVLCDELDGLALSMEDRRRLHTELAARTGAIVHFDPHDFVVVQEQGIAAWRALVKGMAVVPGSWGRVGKR